MALQPYYRVYNRMAVENQIYRIRQKAKRREQKKLCTQKPAGKQFVESKPISKVIKFVKSVANLFKRYF